ncbi:MAG: hypothetical protein EPO24_05250 [Bacteroidetes bacterium]|nr:MAG: hypothetical protein EPO24_05250 [Bacteroidota bacterium]
MKTRIFQIIILFVLCVAGAAAQEPQSFRSLSLGGIIYDDLDLVFDPIELQFVDSLRLYTNLSNTSLKAFTSSANGTSASNEYLLGVSRINPLVDNLWTAVLLRFEKSKVPNSLSLSPDLTGYNFLDGEGELQSEYTEYLDQNGNDLYDLKRSISQKQSSFNDNDAYSFVLNNSYIFDNYTLGFKLTLGNYSYEGNQANGYYGSGHGYLQGSYWNSPSFSRSVDEFYIDSGYSRLQWGERGDYSSKYESPYLRLAASAMRTISEYEVRADVGYYTIDDKNKTDDAYHGSQELFNPRSPTYENTYVEDETNKSGSSKEGGALAVGGSVRYVFDQQIERKNDGYVFLGANMTFESFDYTYSWKNNSSRVETVNDGVAGPLNDFTQEQTGYSGTNDDGTGTSNLFYATLRANKPLSDDVYFGIGASFSISSLKRETKYTNESNYSNRYTKIDNATDWYDYLSTETGSMNANRTYKTYSTFLSLPVAVEYRFSEDMKWKLRLGSVFQYLTSTIDDAMQVTDSKPYTTKTERGDGTAALNINDNKYYSQSEHSNSKETRTYLTYGIGFDPTHNIQIDAIGFFDVDKHTDLESYLQNFMLAIVFKL